MRRTCSSSGVFSQHACLLLRVRRWRHPIGSSQRHLPRHRCATPVQSPCAHRELARLGSERSESRAPRWFRIRTAARGSSHPRNSDNHAHVQTIVSSTESYSGAYSHEFGKDAEPDSPDAYRAIFHRAAGGDVASEEKPPSSASRLASATPILGSSREFGST